MNFTRFDIEDCGTGCTCDKLNIYDGSSDKSTLIKSFCGHETLTSITPSGNMVFLDFQANAYNRYEGFEVHYTTVEGKTGNITKPIITKQVQ